MNFAGCYAYAPVALHWNLVKIKGLVNVLSCVNASEISRIAMNYADYAG